MNPDQDIYLHAVDFTTSKDPDVKRQPSKTTTTTTGRGGKMFEMVQNKQTTTYDNVHNFQQQNHGCHTDQNE